MRKSLSTAIALVAALVALLHLPAEAAQTKPAPPAAASPAKPAVDPLKGLRKSYDKMEGISWYEHPTTPRSAGHAFYVYFGRSDSGAFTHLRLVARYYGDDWLFVKRAWAKADGVSLDVPQKSRFTGWERDNDGGDVWEWTDTPVKNREDIQAVRQMAEAKSVTIRFEGDKYRHDRELSPQQRKAMREVIAAYEAVTGKPWQ